MTARPIMSTDVSMLEVDDVRDAPRGIASDLRPPDTSATPPRPWLHAINA